MTYKPQLDGESDGTPPARVYVWTEDLLAADGLRQALAAQTRVVCVDDLADADVLLWDAGSLPLEAPSVLAQLKAAQASDQCIVALVADAGAAALCAQLGARAALQRRIHAPTLRAAILAARAGLCVYDAAFAESWLPAPAGSMPTSPTAATLTAREHDVLQLLALGLSNGNIAKRLDVSIHTVKFHVNSILAKLSVSTRTAAVSAAIRAGLVTL
jgi:two-component system, NarL family, nitrate/nitrite response regulator NarL